MRDVGEHKYRRRVATLRNFTFNSTPCRLRDALAPRARRRRTHHTPHHARVVHPRGNGGGAGGPAIRHLGQDERARRPADHRPAVQRKPGASGRLKGVKGAGMHVTSSFSRAGAVRAATPTRDAALACPYLPFPQSASGRRPHRPRRPRHVLAAPRRPRPVPHDPCQVHRRPLPRALAHRRVRKRRAAAVDVSPGASAARRACMFGQTSRFVDFRVDCCADCGRVRVHATRPATTVAHCVRMPSRAATRTGAAS